MVLSPEASSEWSEDAPGNSLKNSNSQPASGLFKTENLSTVTENGNVNTCPVEIKICGVESTDVVKQPSYLSLARCISGYTLLTTYDSKQREGYRSRDISPIRAPLPLGMNSHYQTRSTLAASNGGGTVSASDDPTRSDHCTSPSSSSFSAMRASVPFTGLSRSPEARAEKKMSIDVTMESKHCTAQHTEATSFVLQRVERLYGPGALAQGFYARRSLNGRRSIDNQDEVKDNFNNTSSSYSDRNKANNHHDNSLNGNGNVSAVNGVEEALPVMKLLRPEFRAQLTLAKHKVRNPSLDKTDGTHQSPRKEHIIPIKLEESKSPEHYQIIVSPAAAPVKTSLKKDGHYYLQVVHNEMEALQRLADALQSEMASVVIPEELEGQLRSAIGKARLLVNEKMRQFEGLCNKNILQDSSDSFPTTDEDLAGFWDMVSIQVDRVHKEFEDIAKLRNNNWKPVTTPKIKMVGSSNNNNSVTEASCNGSKSSKTSTCSKVNKTVGGAANSSRDEARRKMLQERKLAMKRNMAANANQDQVFIS